VPFSSRHCERSEAIQSLKKILDCFVALLLAMTAEDAVPLIIYGASC